MSGACCDCTPEPAGANRTFRSVLWVALAINIVMFTVEIGASMLAGSSALQADALDFLSDAANYGISLSVAGLVLTWRARAALIKGATMGVFGLGVLISAGWRAMTGLVPHAELMGVIGVAALLANGAVATTLYAYRSGDSNMRSIWLCSRNDVIGNLAILLAALGVFGTGTGWPDVLIALGIAGLGISSARQVIRQALCELSVFRHSALPANIQTR